MKLFQTNTPTTISTLSTILLLSVGVENVVGLLRYSEKSCSDLVPRSVDNIIEGDQEYSQYNGNVGQGGNNDRGSRNKYKISQDYSAEPPYKISATGRRYRRNSDLLGESVITF
jgi:hypothetical protein